MLKVELSFSHYAERLFGYTSTDLEAVIDRSKRSPNELPLFWRLFSTEDWAMLMEVEQLACAGSQTEFTRPVRIRTKLGDQIHCNCSIRYSIDMDGIFTDCVFCIIPSSDVNFPAAISPPPAETFADMRMSDVSSLPLSLLGPAAAGLPPVPAPGFLNSTIFDPVFKAADIC